MSLSDLTARLRGRARVAATSLPAPVKQRINGALNAADPLTVRAYRELAGDDGPIPPRELRRHVGEANLNEFLRGGGKVAHELTSVLDGVGRPFASFRSVLDFGCGCGRVLRPLMDRASPDIAFSGCDLDRGAIGWLAANLPGHYFLSGFWPPLEVPDGAYDLVYAISVFTHLPREKEAAWLAEMYRVIQPGGVGVLTTFGPELLEVYRQGRRPGMRQEWRKRLLSHGALEEELSIFEGEAPDVLASRAPDQAGDTYGLAFHDRTALQARWLEVFDSVEVVPCAINWSQDVVLVTKAGG